MKKFLLTAAVLALVGQAPAQDARMGPDFRLPLTITIFTESIGLPNFRFAEGQTNLGFRIGTEFYYRNSDKGQLIQTLNIGYYVHRGFHNAFFVNTEFGYRHYFNNVFVDGTIGLGYALLRSALPRYTSDGNSFVQKSPVFGRLLPTLGLGAGYRFDGLSVFSRYEMHAEMPFGFKGVPALPHSTFHLGTRIDL
jgi:hypothetical protein